MCLFSNMPVALESRFYGRANQPSVVAHLPKATGGHDDARGRGLTADQPQAFIGLDEIAGTLTLGGCGIGDYYLSTCDNLDAALERTAAENKLLVFFSHGISADASTINMKTAMLEHLLRKAAALSIQPVSFADLP